MSTLPSSEVSGIAPATYYEIRGHAIPARLTLVERETFCRGLGVSPQVSALFALQDRGASLGNQLAALIERSKDAALIAQANTVIEKWNAEVELFFKEHSAP